MEAGLGLLGLSPAVFWAMTPRELEAALRGRLQASGAIPPLPAPDLHALMRRYPDREP
jgi:uncharacterized phage protein (TIGR02216 family)